MKKIRKHQEPRYHIIAPLGVADDDLGVGVVEMVVDFKRYFTIPTAELYARRSLPADLKCRCHLQSPYLEQFANRFNSYLGRVAIPDDLEEPPGGARFEAIALG